jgi:hypothetical protein
LSKSGLGGSVGVKGLRVGSGPRGRYLHAGREGLYYKASLDEPAPGSQPVRERTEAVSEATGDSGSPLAGSAVDPGKNQLGVRLLRGLFGALRRRSRLRS